jgi:hypothetical protein
MPRKEINYQNTVIYKIQHTEKDDLLYVGHTTDFTKRKNNHKCKCTNPNSSRYNIKLYTMIRENGGWDMFKMIEIIKFPCNDHNEACAEEDKIMREMKANLNTISSVFDHEKLKLKNKRADEKRNKTPERIEYRKKYYEDNRDRIKAQKKIYDEESCGKMTKQTSDLVQCECGCFVQRKTKGSLKHTQSQRHKDGMKIFAPTIV